MKFGQLVSNENQQARFKTFSTLKMIFQGCSMKAATLEKYRGFFRGVVRSFIIKWVLHIHFWWIVVNQNKTIWTQDTIHFENVICRVFHERSNITALYAEHLKFQEKLNSTHSLRVKRGKTQHCTKNEVFHSRFLQ